jgi:MinD-like ATPase involved in chromosome partitioning or flagellar assembly
MEPTIALVFSPESWVERLHRHLTDHGGARVRQIVLDPSLALEDEYDTLVVSHRWPGLTRSLVDAVHGRGRGVLGVVDPEEPAGHDRLTMLGVDAVVPSDASIAAFVDVIAALAPAGTRTDTERSRGTAHESGCRPAVVSGPGGAGTSEIALGLTAAIAARGERVVLVDANEVASSTAARLALPIEPNLRNAIDAVQYGRGALHDALLAVGRPSFEVLPGCPSVAATAQINSREVLDVVAALGGLASNVVVEVTGLPGADIARAVLVEAGAVIGVGAANPVSVARMLDWIAGLPPGVGPAHLVFNRAPADRFERAEVTAEICRTFTPSSVTFIPVDRRVERAAWTGDVVRRGTFTAAVAALAEVAVPRRAAPGRSVRWARRRRSAA